jgi:hypothetical protein
MADFRKLINEDERRPHLRAALEYLSETLGPDNIGEDLEFGSDAGTSLTRMHAELRRLKLDHVRLFGFDSFAGLPNDREGNWTQGDFCAGHEDVVGLPEKNDIDWSRTILTKGLFRDTLNAEPAAR